MLIDALETARTEARTAPVAQAREHSAVIAAGDLLEIAGGSRGRLQLQHRELDFVTFHTQCLALGVKRKWNDSSTGVRTAWAASG